MKALLSLHQRKGTPQSIGVKNEAGSYRYPADKATKDALLAQGWHLDGVAWTKNFSIKAN